MKDYTYEVKILDRQGNEVSIYGPTKSLRGARNVALNTKRQVRIYRDNKLLQNGQNGLDQQAYEIWLEEHQEEQNGN